MKGKTDELIALAEEHLQRRRLIFAAKYLEEASRTIADEKHTTQLLIRAGETYGEMRMIKDAERCYRRTSQLLVKKEKAECLMAYWRLLILEIACCQYDCGFEWRGAVDGSHDSDHDYYQKTIREYQKKAEQLLAEILNVKGIKRRQVLKDARAECKKREKDGWGASICWNIIENVERRGKTEDNETSSVDELRDAFKTFTQKVTKALKSMKE